jgi:hypothetical protein
MSPYICGPIAALFSICFVVSYGQFAFHVTGNSVAPDLKYQRGVGQPHVSPNARRQRRKKQLTS